MKRSYFLLSTALLLSSCFVYKNTPKSAPLLARYSKLMPPVPATAGNDPIVLITLANVAGDAPDTSKPKTILNFQGPGQKELIAAYAKMSKTPDELKTALNATYLQKGSNGSVEDYSTAGVTFTISLSPKDPGQITTQNLALGDRLERVKMVFQLANGQQGVYFKTWDRFKTQYGRFFIGSRSFTGNQEVNINPSLTLANSAALSLGNYDSKSQYVEQDTISEQVVVSNGILNDDNFSISQTGTPKTSLLGNTAINLTIGNHHPKPAIISSFEKLVGENAVLQPTDVKLNLKDIILPGYKHDIIGKLTITYLYRHIVGGDRTYSEADDTVAYTYGTLSQDQIVLLKKQDLHPTFYELLDPVKKLVFQLQDKTGFNAHPFDLLFSSQDDADNFLTWLKLVSKTNDVTFNKRYKLVVQDAKGIHNVDSAFDLTNFAAKDID